LADPTDINLALMLWYALEACDQPAKSGARPHLIDIALHSQIPLIRKLSARRLAEAIDSNPGDVGALLQQMPDSPAAAADILSGLLVGFQGRRSAPKPMLWDTVVAKLNRGGNETVQRATRDLSVLFGDGRALNEVRTIALDGNADLPTRRAALQTLIDSRASDLRAICEKVIGTRELATIAARGLATFDDPTVGRLLVGRFGGVWEHDRPDLISVLVSRRSFAKALLDAVAAGAIPRQSISAFHARQIRSLNDPAITQRLGQLWGEVRETDAARREMIARLKTQLSSDALAKADQRAGRALFQQMCATCHRLYGEGGQLGPDLTGSARDNLTYLLENIVDPNAIIPVDAHVSVVTLRDGRILTGLIGATTESTVTVRGLTETRNVERRDIAKTEELAQSLMPEGLLDALDEKQVHDLIAYLMSRQQVPLPAP
jgi:putative heme-binding domain-containing protein